MPKIFSFFSKVFGETGDSIFKEKNIKKFGILHLPVYTF